jgi:tryptophan synthase alpha chain
MKRLEKKFSELKNKSAFIAYVCGGDPDFETSLALLKSMPQAGVDIIELGVPFLDPAGDGPIIENAAKRSIANGGSLKKILKMVEEFRKENQETPLILMGYFNPFLKYGIDKIFLDAANSGVDGVLIVDLPLEEEEEVLPEIKKSKLDLIGLISPNTTNKRAKKIAENSSGFLYLISMLGITGTKVAKIAENKIKLNDLRQASSLPIAIGFGIKNPEIAQEFSQIGADAIVVGSAIVKEINDNFLAKNSSAKIVENTLKLIEDFSSKIKN